MSSTPPERARESDLLHERVRAFGARWGPRAWHGHAKAGALAADFDALALAIARYQRRWSAAHRRLQAATAAALESASDLPALPVDAFRVCRVAVHAPEEDSARFLTSGTTSGARGTHPFRSLATYRELAVALGRAALLPPTAARVTAVALTHPFEPERESSLGFMIQCLMEALDGRRLGGVGGFRPEESGRWLLGDEGVDVAGLERAVGIACSRSEPLLLFATSLSLASLVEQLGAARLPLPPGSVVMQTGGFKGRRRSASAAELTEAVMAAFALPASGLIAEYGMTELSSQLYAARDLYSAPPWLRVTAVDPVSHRRVAEGTVGLACFVDLANVDSALSVVTQDQIIEERGGIRLLGRAPAAPLRGCSLQFEELVEGSSERGSIA